MTRSDRARQLLEGHQSALLLALTRIEGDPGAVFQRNLCARLLREVTAALVWPVEALPLALGEFGPNGKGPAIEDACKQALADQNRNPGRKAA